MSGFNDMFSQLDQQTGNALAPPAPPPKPTGMQSMFDALDNDPKIRATSNLVAAQSVAPEHAAAALQASRAIGIPQPAAEENLDQAKQSAQLQSNVNTLDQNPNLANFVADNPLAARLAQDDFQKLGTLEQLTTALKTGVGGALMGNELGRQGSLKQAASLVGANTPAIDQKITGLQGAMAAQPKLTGGMGFVQNFTGFLTGLVDNAIQGGAQGSVIGAGIGAAAGAPVGGVGALPGAAAGAVTGGVVGFNVDMARVAAGNAYLKMGQIRGADGQPLSEGGKQFGAIFTGAATYALGTYASKIESKLMGETAETLAQQAIAKAVQTPTFTQAVKSFASDTFKGAAQGAGIMTAMEASGIIGEEIAKAASSGHFDTNPQEIVDRLSDAAINGALLLGAMHGSMHGLSLYGDVRSALRAQSQAAMFKNILDGSTDAKLRERDLQAFQTFMQHQTDGSPVENLYLPADKVRELYQGARIDPNNMTADPLFSFVPDMAKQLQESAANGGGGDVVIPTSDFVTHLAGTPLAEHLLPDLRVGADAMSVNEAKTFQAEYQERIKAAVDEAGKGAEPDSTQKIADEVRAQAKAAGYSDALASRYGAIYAARYAARGERMGMDPYEAYKQGGVEIAPAEGGKEPPAKPAKPATDKEIGQRLSDKISSNFDAAVHEYSTLPDSEGGKVLNTDTARELSPDYMANRTKSAAVHEAASKFVKDLYARMLAQPPKPGEQPIVLFTAGGTGSGKSSAIKGLPGISEMAKGAQIVFDTNMNGYESSKLKIEQALDAGKDVRIAVVVRDPEDALVNGALPRAERQRDEFGTGRTVPIKEHIKTHLGAIETVKKLIAEYANEPRVKFRIIDNSLGKGKQVERSVDWFNDLQYNEVEQRVKAALEREHEQGRISQETYRGFAGETSKAADKKDSGRTSRNRSVRSSDRASPGGVPETPHNLGQVVEGESPAFKGGAGRVTEAVTERGESVAVQYRLAEVGELVTSHTDDLTPNPEFPQELQPRDRARAASTEQISRIENNIRPELLGESVKASDGAAIVGSDGVVESGNARTIAVRRAYASGKAEAYKAWLERNAEKFGLDAAQVKKMKQPLLVRQRTGEVDRAEFARQANESAVASMSPTEQARSDASRLSDLSGLVANEDGTINMGQSAEFIRQFMTQAVAPTELGSMTQANGQLSQAGMQRIRNAIFAKAYGDADLVSMLTESTDSNVRNILAGMLRAAPEIARVRDLMDAGARHSMDLSGSLVQAVRLFSQLRSEGRTVDQFLAQGSMFDSGLRPDVEAMLKKLQADSRAPKRIAEMIQGLADGVDGMGDPRQAGMFGDAPSGEDALTALVNAPTKTYQQDNRGAIRFEDGKTVIKMFADKDPSTLMHESSHAWLEELVSDGSGEDAPQQLKDDLATVREWLGNDGGALTDEQHEQFARAGEAYLMEGKAPSIALARVFSRFKQWLTKLYRTVAKLDTPINDDIRGVFDRLLATDAEIDEAKRSTGLEPNFKSKEDAGMTTAEWKAYTDAIDRANQQAESTLLDKMMAKVRRQRTVEYKEERAKAVEAATTEVDARPDIQALTMLRSVKADAEKIRLSSADIESVYGKDGVASMPKGTLAKDGVHPDYVAEMLGFNSGDELVKSLQALEKQQREIQAQEGEKRNIRKYLIDQAADQKMEPHTADMLDEQSIREEAQAAVHSESRAALLAQELRYLKRSAARALEERGQGRKATDQVKTEAKWNAAEADLMAKLDKAQSLAAAEEKAGKATDKAQAEIADLKQQIADLKMTDRWKDAEADLVQKMENAKQADEQRRLRESVLITRETIEAIGKQVDGILDNKTTEEIGTFSTYLRDERKAARLVQQAILKKDWAAAAAAKQRQLISHILYSKAKAASDVIDRSTSNMKRLTDKKSFKSMEQEYTDQIQDLLRRFGFDSGRGDELQRALKGSLEDFVKTKSEESGIELSVDPALYTLSKDVKSLTYAQFKALDEAVRSMQEIGRGMKMIEVDGQLRDVEEVKAEIAAAIRELGERMKSDFYDPRDAGQLAAAREKLFGIFRGIDASLTKPEALFDQIDKGNAFGIMNRAIFRRLKEAQGREDAWHEVASKEMKSAVEAAGKDWAKHLSDVVPDEPGLLNPETARPMKLTRKRMISMALNWGNEGNRIKLAEGYKWNPSTIQQFLNKNMTKADWDFAQRVWKMFDSHKQDLDDLQRRVTGVGLDMVQADAFDTPHGRYEGGYYPIVYDAGKSYQAEAHAEKATEALFPSNYTRATTPKGSTISRVEGVKRPIQLSLDVAPWKIGQTIHDLAFREAIIDADRLLSSDSVKKAMDDVFGPEYRKMLRPWLKHIANSKNIDDAAISWMDKAISTARTNTVIVGIGFRLSTMFKHGFSALSNSFKEVGPEWMLKGTREFYAPGRLKENWDFITSKSAEMKYRMNAYDKDVTSQYNELIGNSAYTNFQKQAQHFGHLGVSYLDLGSAAPTWLGAYRKALSQGMEDKDAVYMADKTVRNAHGAQGITDTAQIQRTKGVANLVNMFYGFFNHIYNRQRTMFIQGAEGIKNTKAGDYKAASKNFADVLATSFWYLAVPALVEAMATHGGPSEQKDEGWGEWASKAILAEIPAGIPVIRDIAKAAIEGRDYEVSPIAKAVTDVLHAGHDISDMVQGLDPKESMGKHIATAVGYVAGLPTAAPFTAGKFLWDINNGDADPQSIKDWYQGLTRGKVTQE